MPGWARRPTSSAGAWAARTRTTPTWILRRSKPYVDPRVLRRVPMKWMIVVGGALAFGVSALAQSGGKADVFSSSAVHAKIAELAPQSASAGSAGAVLADYGSHKVQISVRSTSGGAEVHAHYDDIMIVQQGTATLITGGTIPDAKSGADGETHGTSIQG